MIGDPYPFLTHEYISASDTLFYTFLSISDKAIIPKAIAYTPIEKGNQKYYNLGFGDLVLNQKTGNYSIDDKTESNNGDVKTIFYTVISTLAYFFDLHPKTIVYIEGSTSQRMDVYRGLIARHWRQIEPIYQVKGCLNENLIPFQPGVKYKYILILRKEG